MKPDFSIEDLLANNGQMVIGVDEVGRGAIAGPVTVCALMIHQRNLLPSAINDSKKLSAKKRIELFQAISLTTSYSIISVPARIIEEINIVNSTKLAMRAAIKMLCHKIQPITAPIILVDGNFIPQFDCTIDPQSRFIIHGDAKSITISSASIMAKVVRDQIMTDYEKIYNSYSFSRHKGYGTKQHLDEIDLCGVSPLHRKSWLP